MPDRTPLYTRHLALNARMIEFGGWEMPLWYSSITDEHLSVRSSVGVFDASHMGKLMITGAEADRELEHLLTRSIHDISPGRCVYAHMLNELGGIVDDMIVTKIGGERFFVVCNASTRSHVAERMREGLRDAELEDLTNRICCLPIQGPASIELMGRLCESPIEKMRRYHAAVARIGTVVNGKTERSDLSWAEEMPSISDGVESGVPIVLSRTGYTGEDGVEIFASAQDAPQIWDSILDMKHEPPVHPAGLGARDTLRMEMCYLLSGHDFDSSRTPLEADVNSVIDWDHEFIGKDALERQREEDFFRLVAFVSSGRGIPREGYPITSEAGDPLGNVTSGTISPSLKIGIGMGYVPPEMAAPDTIIYYSIGSRRVKAKIVRKPFLRRPGLSS